jgi:hypothetical protein
MKNNSCLVLGFVASAMLLFSCSLERQSHVYNDFGSGFFGNFKVTSEQKYNVYHNVDSVEYLTKTLFKTTAFLPATKEKKEQLKIKNLCDKKPLKLNKNNISKVHAKIHKEESSSDFVKNKFPGKKSQIAAGDSGGWGIAAFVCGILGWIVFPALFITLSIIFGILGINKKLKGLAIAGLVLGLIALLVMGVLLGAVLEL